MAELKIEKISINEFREKGFLQEANRLFSHPLGLALAVEIDKNGEERFCGIMDSRDDPEGLYFGSDVIDQKKIDHVKKLGESKQETRLKNLGWVIQPS